MMKTVTVGFRLSRWWNRFAYSLIHLGRFFIWDYTGKNAFLLDDDDFASDTAEAVLCDRV